MAKSSEMSWRGYEDVPKLCRVCGEKVTLTGAGGGFRAHTAGPVRWLAHTECLRLSSTS